MGNTDSPKLDFCQKGNLDLARKKKRIHYHNCRELQMGINKELNITLQQIGSRFNMAAHAGKSASGSHELRPVWKHHKLAWLMISPVHEGSTAGD